MDDQAPRLHAGVGEVKTQIFLKTHGFLLDQAPRLHAGVGEVKTQICRNLEKLDFWTKPRGCMPEWARYMLFFRTLVTHTK